MCTFTLMRHIFIMYFAKARMPARTQFDKKTSLG